MDDGELHRAGLRRHLYHLTCPLCPGVFSDSTASFNTVPVGFALLPDKLMSTYILMMTTIKKVVDLEPRVMERVTVEIERGL